MTNKKRYHWTWWFVFAPIAALVLFAAAVAVAHAMEIAAERGF